MLAGREPRTGVSAALGGVCDARFSAVADTMAANFEEGLEVGAAVCVYLDGRPVVDLWAGSMDAAGARPWERDTMVNVASTTKGLVAVCVHLLVERGLLDLDAAVARYWPEFAQAGKAEVPVRWLLSHRAGLPAVRREMAPEALFEWPAFPRALEATAPWWTPGTQHGYHALTWGYLVGELIRRVHGRTVGQLLHSEVAGPLGADCFIGLPASEEHRVADVLPESPSASTGPTIWDLLRHDPTSMRARAMINPPWTHAMLNTRAWRRAEIPSANGHATARGIARVYAMLAAGGTLDGARILSPATIDAAAVEQAAGPDAVLGVATRFGLGFMLTTDECPLGPGPRAFGHVGSGGSIGFADPDARVGFGYVTNLYRTGTLRQPDQRWPALVEAVYASR